MSLTQEWRRQSQLYPGASNLCRCRAGRCRQRVRALGAGRDAPRDARGCAHTVSPARLRAPPQLAELTSGARRTEEEHLVSVGVIGINQVGAAARERRTRSLATCRGELGSRALAGG